MSRAGGRRSRRRTDVGGRAPDRRSAPRAIRRLRRRGRSLGIVVGVALTLAVLVGVGTASASAGAAAICGPVHLTGQGEATSATTTRADIFWNGRRVATTTGSFTAPDSRGAFTGTVTVIPRRFPGGSLVTTVSGAYGPDFTTFTAQGPARGTGTLSRTSGYLRFAGPLRSDGTFSETIDGTLCADVRTW